ncbi:MAG: arginyltransferase [Spongiibacteraceae bacterium]|jgi:arginine-tRNA-protein transferase|nr:arginyltransferase [Spongiibacteraceae bacterium]
MTALSRLKVFATHPHDCSYLEDQQATTLFVDPAAEMDSETYSQLSEMGFRRSGPHLYRPHCASCNACVAARIPVERFQPSRQQRRVWSRNRDLSVIGRHALDDDRYYTLYASYIEQRHRDGDMYPPSRAQFDAFLTAEWDITRYYCFELGDELLAVAVVDLMQGGLSAIYTFYEPALGRRSLGVYAVLWQIEEARRLGLPYVYLGYWIKQCPKMSYKVNYRPLELLINGRWVCVN